MDEQPDLGDRSGADGDFYAHTAPAEPARRSRSTLQVVLWSLAAVLVLSGIVVAGLVFAFAVALSQFGSNK
jgi:hypothetical protein